MKPLDDTERLDAIGKYGLCVATHDTLQHGQWERAWVCQYGPGMERVMMAPTIREVIDAAVLDITTNGPAKH